MPYLHKVIPSGDEKDNPTLPGHLAAGGSLMVSRKNLSNATKKMLAAKAMAAVKHAPLNWSRDTTGQ